MVCFLRLLSRTITPNRGYWHKADGLVLYLVELVSDPRHRAFSINSTYRGLGQTA